MKKQINDLFSEIIEKERESKYSNNFENLINSFDEKFNELKSESKRLNIETYINSNSTEKGLCVFFYEDKPFYVGISGNIRKRIMQHVNGRSETTSTLAYKIAKLIFEKKGKKHTRTKKDFFENNIELINKIKICLKEMKLAIIEISDDDELALFEIYCSMKFKTSLNSFKTH